MPLRGGILSKHKSVMHKAMMHVSVSYLGSSNVKRSRAWYEYFREIII